jgi:hypothetical protein
MRVIVTKALPIREGFDQEVYLFANSKYILVSTLANTIEVDAQAELMVGKFGYTQAEFEQQKASDPTLEETAAFHCNANGDIGTPPKLIHRDCGPGSRDRVLDVLVEQEMRFLKQ